MNSENRQTAMTLLYVAGIMGAVTGLYNYVKNHPPAFLERFQYPPRLTIQETPNKSLVRNQLESKVNDFDLPTTQRNAFFINGRMISGACPPQTFNSDIESYIEKDWSVTDIKVIQLEDKKPESQPNKR